MKSPKQLMDWLEGITQTIPDTSDSVVDEIFAVLVLVLDDIEKEAVDMSLGLADD